MANDQQKATIKNIKHLIEVDLNYEEALLESQLLLKQLPRNDQLYYLIGTCTLLAGASNEQALQYLDLAIRYGYDDEPNAWMNRGVALSRLGNSEMAIKSFEQALKRMPAHEAAKAAIEKLSSRH